MKPQTARNMYDAAMTLAFVEKDCGPYAAALSTLAGVKVRKARVFCGLDEGRLSGPARVRLTAAQARYDHVVPCSGAHQMCNALRSFGRGFTFGSYEGLASMFDGAVFLVRENSAASAHGALAAQLKLPVAGVIAANLDPVVLLHAFLMTAQPPSGYVATIVVAVPYLDSLEGMQALLDWTGRLLRACGPVRYQGAPSYGQLPWFRVIAAVDPRCACHDGALRSAFGDEVVRFDTL